ncbi:hypothetical protein [Pyrodictium abyssi]|uniref:Uncharacterized protein n=1 Tax=Pyrodictium abyssi TaxID=54256 RepID=A0ABM8ISD3_9CREN|nr:hypothetical protein PABY_00450 [Pyrodictium abyssi]
MHRLYEEACQGLRLCPRPLPPGLRGAEPSILARVDPLLASSITGGEPALYYEGLWLLQGLLRRLRGRECPYCGRPALHAAGAWSISVEGVEGKAILEGLVPLCGSCLLTYRLDEAFSRGLLREAVRHLVVVNWVPEDVALAVVDRVLGEWKETLRVRRWSIEMPGLLDYGMDRDHVGVLEELAERLVNPPYLVEDEWLLVLGGDAEAQRARAAEALEALCEGRLGAAALAAKAAELGLSTEPKRIKMYVESLIARDVCRKPLYKALEMLEGAWLLMVPRRLRAWLVVALAEEAEKSPWLLRLETPLGPREPAPVAIYTASVFDVAGIAEAARRLHELLPGQPLAMAYKPGLPGHRLANHLLYSY